MAIRPVNTEEFGRIVKGGVYGAIVVAAKRARQLHNDTKIELNQRLETLQQLTQTVDTEDETDISANPDQLKISLEFEKRSKPTESALSELGEKRLEWRLREEEKPVEPEAEEPPKEDEPEAA